MKFSEIKASHICLRRKDISGRENVLSKIREFIKLQKKQKHVGRSFQFFKLIKSLRVLQLPEHQSNLTANEY